MGPDEVTLHYWRSTGRNVGHIAIKIDDMNYLSWWPNNNEILRPHKIGYLVQHLPSHPDYEGTSQGEISDRAAASLERRYQADLRDPLPFADNDQEGYLPRQGQERIDENHWVQRPHSIVEIPVVGGPHDNLVGLNHDNLLGFYRAMKSAPNQMYQMFSTRHNCASVALTALKAAGSDLFAEKDLAFHERNFLTKPEHVYQYAIRVRDRIQELNSRTQDYKRTANNYKLTFLREDDYTRGADKNTITATPKVRAPDNNRLSRHLEARNQVKGIPDDWVQNKLWTCDEWKKYSKVEVSWRTGLATRGGQVKAIDGYLKKYDSLANNEDTRKQRLDLVCEMLKQANDHLRSKPKSDRKMAVLCLSRQLAYEVKKITRPMNEDEVNRDYSWANLFWQD